MKKKKLSLISSIHFVKLFYRSILFILALILYIYCRINDKSDIFHNFGYSFILLGIIWLVYVCEMIMRFFPSKFESMGCQKQFKKNYIPIENGETRLQSENRTLLVVLFWILLNLIIGLLYWFNLIDASILILISLAYGICDMICILFFCPFQTWIMKNRCCTVCRIYNWDFIMMFTPCLFIPHLYTWSLFILSLILLLRWEFTYLKHPERFSDATNAYVTCSNCTEKLCHHKKQLQSFIKKNKEFLFNQKNKIIDKVKSIKKKDNEDI